MGRAHHLQDNRLLECYLAERQSEQIDPRSAEHLADCETCGQRYSELAQLMDDVRAEVDIEVDEIFTADRLRAQQQHIARRLETVTRPARVLTFPGRVVRRTFAATTTRTAPRWAAAAAAAGLFVGIALGASYEWESRARTGLLGVTARSASQARTIAVPARGNDDEAFMSELEFALERPRTPELAAFEAFTPRVREVSTER